MSRLVVDHLVKEFPTRAEPLVVLRGVSFELDSGQNMAIVGPSGSGKSTLLNAIGALEPPTAGRVLLGDVDPWTLGSADLAAFRNRQIGFVFQDHHLLPQCSVFENVLVPCLAGGPIPAERIERARSLVASVGLTDRMDYRPAELSGGERQRAALARALVNQPTLLLADEPTGNLDRASGERVARLLLDLQQRESMMLVVVTHSERLAAMMDRRVRLDDGRLCECEP